MHDIVIDELERHLSGSGESQNASRAFYAHLDACADCRTEVAGMDAMSAMIREMSFDPELAPSAEPSLGFDNRVRNRIVEKQQKEAWGLFSPGAAFFRRVAFASLLLIAGLGSFLVTRESSFSGTDAATIMAQHDPVATHSEASDRDRLLVTLATYRE
jgi:anti-sigma factor RsiW